jgi:hypothetical protein
MASESDPSTPPHRRLRRLGTVLLTLAVALGGVVLLLLFFQGRDSSQLDRPATTASGPGTRFPDQGHAHLRAGERPDEPYASDPPTSGPHAPAAIDRDGARLSDDQILHALELGDVVLLSGAAEPPPALRALARRLAGPFDPALAAGGQAIVLGQRPGTEGVVALAWRRMLRVSGPSDPALEAFASHWLGRGAGG